MRSFGSNLLLGLVLVVGCGRVSEQEWCREPESTCDLAPGAVCIGGRCAVPSAECPSGFAFAEDESGLGGECVAMDPSDAGFPADASDAGVSVADAGADAGRQGVWGTPMKLQVISASDRNDTAPTIRADGLEIYSHSNRAQVGEYDIYVATRASAAVPFGLPEVVTVSVDGAYDIAPVLSKDGLTLWFASTRSGGRGGFDVYRSTRSTFSSTWSAPVRVDELNTVSQDVPSSITSDGLLLGLTSNRDGQGFDLYAATRASATGIFSVARVAELATTMDEEHPAFSDDRLRVYFTAADKDLYMAERSSAAVKFGSPVRILELSSDDTENHVEIAPDERTIWFTSVRDGTEDIFEARR